MKMSWRESLRLGALMNTRGLMELIVLNIGYDLGILSLSIFTMLVLMALITTLMTGPLLSLFRDKAVVELR
jgi:Kef-type K+ transport system membrane component KefB